MDGGEDVTLNAYSLQGRRKTQSVDGGGKHAHLVALDAVEALVGSGKATEDVAAANHDAHLDAHIDNLLDLLGILGQTLFVDAVLLFAHERFAAQLQ